MNQLFSYRVNRLSAYFALWGFVMSTIMFLLYMASESEIMMGLVIAIIAIYLVLTPISLTILTLNAIINYKDLKQHVLAIFMVLLSSLMLFLYSNFLINF